MEPQNAATHERIVRNEMNVLTEATRRLCGAAGADLTAALNALDLVEKHVASARQSLLDLGLDTWDEEY